MAQTLGYQAGVETNQSQYSYGVEATWGTAPATTFQAIRYTGESLSFQKTRARPSEINNTREVSAAVTQKQEAKGAINFALSYGTFDDFFSVLMGNDFGAAQSINAISTDLTITSATNILSSTLGSKFTAIQQGSWIRTVGFTNTVNNGLWYVTTKTDNSHLVLSGPGTAAIITETSTGATQGVRAQTLRNGVQFKSLYLQQKLSTSLFMRYPGMFISGMSLSGGIGKFVDGSFDILAQQELSGNADISTGGIIAAPSGRVNDPVGGFLGVYLNGVALGNPALNVLVDSFTLKATNNNAALEFNLGSAAAVGILQGMFEVSGTIKGYFKDFTVYNRFINETSGVLSFITGDNASNSYAISMPVATFNADAITSGGPDQPVYSDISFMADPAATGGSLTIDKLPAS